MKKFPLKGLIDTTCAIFSPDDDIRAPQTPAEHRFPSLVTAVFRFVLRLWFVVLPLLWAGMLIGCITAGLPVLGVIFTSVIATALAAILLVLLFLVLMAVESIAGHIASLILYGTLAHGRENPIDSFLSGVLKGEF